MSSSPQSPESVYMSPQVHYCVLCGQLIDDDYSDRTGWTSEFRILYTIGDQIAVTGIGGFTDPGASYLVAPLEFDAWWYTSQPGVEIGVICQSPIDGRYGFPFHRACWFLLEKVYFNKPIPLRRLFDVCRSLPYSHRIECLIWGHDFGGLIAVDDDDSYPWEDLFIEKEVSFARTNPSTALNTNYVVYEYPPPAPKRSTTVSDRADIFSKLPLEIIISISVYLPTADYFNARLTFRSFHPVINSLQFWASRFLPNADRSWVFESRKWAKDCYWSWHYYRIASGSPRMRNRERVWRLLETVEAILCLEWVEPPSYHVVNESNTGWLTVAADIRPETEQPYENFGGGCRKFYEKQICIPPGELSQLGFSFIQVGLVTHITGIRVVLTHGENIRVGYMADEKRVQQAENLTGFKLAVGQRGIQAIQYILGGDRELPWIGSPDNAPITKRLRFAGPITGIKVAFDGYKLVSIAATCCAGLAEDNFRDSSFWYPRVPEINLNLNADSFTARETATTRYDPICWTMFGGPSGMYLKMLTGISVTTDEGHVRTIEFQYNSEAVPLECRKIGRNTPSDYATVMNFYIDGPCGEVIESITVYIREYASEDEAWYYNTGVLESFEILTNWGNSRHFDTTVRGTASHTPYVEKSIILVEGCPIWGLSGLSMTIGLWLWGGSRKMC